MQKKIIFILFFAKTILLFSQNLSFVYEVTTNAGDKSSKTENYYLDISDSNSVFRSENDRFYDSIREKTGRGISMPINFNQLYSRKDKLKKEVYKTVTIPLVLDTYDILIEEGLKWQLSDEKTLINNIECQKATVKYGGRVWDAWFAKSIAIPEGPYIFHGLPGLIVKLTDASNDFKFSLVYYTGKNQDFFSPPKKGKILDFPKLKLIEENFYSNPFAELERNNTKLVVTDEKGNAKSSNYRILSQKMQKTLKENNNPIELNYKPDFK